MAKALTTQNLSALLLRNSQFPEDFVQDYMNVAINFNIISTQFQALKNGVQATTGAYAPLIGWTQDRNVGGFNFDPATGELTIQATGDYVLDVVVKGSAATGIEIKAQQYDGSVWADLAGAFGAGTSVAVINGLQISTSLSYKLRIVVKDTGGSVNIVTNAARLSVQRKS